MGKKSTVYLNKISMFSNVYRGNYNRGDKKVQVAIKVCKSDSDQDANKFLMDEACKTKLVKIVILKKFLDTMSQFQHKHIIQLVGIASANTVVWIVLELAPLGELR